MSKRLLTITLAGISLGLVGCDSLLYDNQLAPVFSSPSSKKQAPPPLTGGTVTASNAPTASIEKTGTQNNSTVVVNSAQTNPYGNSAPRRPSAVQASNATVAEQTAKAQAAQQNAEQTVAVTPATTAKADSRIREGSEVLKETQTAAENTATQASNAAQTTTETAAAKRPTSMRPTAVQQQAKAKAEQAAQSASNKADTATTAAATATTAAVKKSPSTTQSATRQLLQEAKDAVRAGQYDKAASALERAHRIQPGNAKILYDIAQIRYAQGKYRQAESFASKAANYSRSKGLSKKIWSLLSNARKALGNSTGAAAAAKKAANF